METAVERWLAAALNYLPRWLEHQLRLTEQPGLQFAVALNGKPVLDLALGHADLPAGQALTTRHRFRVASHSKSFTAAAVMKLRDQGRLRLDDPVGRWVSGLHADVARATLAQLLSHSAGLVRDGADSGQWLERRPFLDEAELRADLAAGPTLDVNTRFKYSNHGYGLLGLVIQAASGEPWADWVGREIVAASGLADTRPDVGTLSDGSDLRLAHGHSAKWPLGTRLAIPADMSTRALGAATGFVSTPADLARFFHSLSPSAKTSVLSVAARREMTRRQWREPHASAEPDYKVAIARYEEFCDLLHAQAARGLSAAVYTQTTDCETETNGLMTYDRRVMKITPEVAALAARLGTERATPA